MFNNKQVIERINEIASLSDYRTSVKHCSKSLSGSLPLKLYTLIFKELKESKKTKAVKFNLIDSLHLFHNSLNQALDSNLISFTSNEAI